MRVLQTIATNIYLKHLLSFFNFILLYFLFSFCRSFFIFVFNRVSIVHLLFVFLFLSLSSYFQNCELLYTYNVTYTWRIAVREVQSKKKLRRESFSKTPQRVGFVVPSRVVVNTLKSSLITNTRSCALLILYITKTRINIQCYKTTTCSIFSSQ